MEKTCEQCGNVFTVKSLREANRFCSRTCYFENLKTAGRPDRIAPTTEFKCENCERPFFFKPGHLRSYRRQWGQEPKYCSRACSHVGRTHVEEKTCPICGATFATSGHSLNRTETCSDPCRRALQQRNLIARNEKVRPSDEREVQRSITKQGYVRLRFPNKHGVKGREVLEHRWVMEQHLGRELRPEETVHHRVKPTTFNDPSNLELFSSRHGPGQRVSEQIEWAAKLFADYPDLAAAAGYQLTPLEPAGSILELYATSAAVVA